ncbi:sensor histidine kinase [Bifidobacterium leontopitheci]|nr:hypothetical protein [Bifidobacterium leontopitheci]
MMLWGAAAFSLMLFMLEWFNTEGLYGIDIAQYAIVSVLTILLPLWPVPFAVALLVVNLLMAVAPFGGAGYVSGLEPMLLASAVLVVRWGRITIAGAISAICVLAYAVEILFDLTFSPGYPVLLVLENLMPLALAWTVGAIIRWAHTMERERVAEEERAQRREQQLMLMHVLHDSVANNLTYAASRCSLLLDENPASDGSRHALSDQDRAAVLEISLIIDQSLQEIRQRIIVPVKHDLMPEAAESGDSEAARQPRDTMAEVSSIEQLHEVMATSGKRLHRDGFTGVPQLEGDIVGLTEPMLRFLADAVRELAGNMLKYGRPGPFTLLVNVAACADVINAPDADGGATEAGVTVMASNPMRDSITEEEHGPANDANSNAVSCFRRPADQSSAQTPERSSERFPVKSTRSGLETLRMETLRLGGEFNRSAEDGEWTVYIHVPLHTQVTTGTKEGDAS